MSDEILSQNQVEDLIRAMESEGSGQPKAAAPSSPAANVAPRSTLSASRFNDPKLRPMNYDFKRPERVGKELMGAMRSLHEGLGRAFNAKLSGLLRSITEVKLVSADQLTYSEFVYSLDTPTCFCVLDVKPLEGNWILDIAPTLSFAVVDRMLGGDPQPNDLPNRALTEIEHRLMARVTKLFLDGMQTTWQSVAEMEPTLRSIESNPQLVQIVPPNEVIVLICFEVTMGKNRGMMNLCIPYNSIERFSSQLSSKGWGGYSSNPATPESKQALETQLDSALVELTVTLARSKIKTGDLLSMDVGDVITTEHQIDNPLEVAIQSVPKFKATVGALKGKKAVRIRDHIDLRPKPPAAEAAKS
ncbi:Flagellar motor switch protein FliM [Rosistilla ulvae]|uniref:Flagellar motor switch protein FliM n=1 Tax=Rosistilla ulvae TaxID=1930277 RepID=A0A517LVA3_9BACT|nr:flagellar motor switch protein FliM [Rosistilla ulvae]QDS86554.1 Flagellar motor switch protein FliM [Rosistilla ulvae]